MLYLLESLTKGDDLSEARKVRAHKQSFGKHTSGVTTGDTPSVSKSEDDEDDDRTVKSLGLYVSV